MTENQKKEFRRKIKYLMIDKNVHQREMAKAAGVSEQMVSMVISGVKQPPLKVAIAIAKTLGVTVDELFT